MGIYEQLQRAKERQKSTAARKDVHGAAGSTTVRDDGKKRSPDKRECSSDVGKGRSGRSVSSLTEPERQAGTQALPVDTPSKPKIGRPKTDFDRTEYQKLYMRDKATIKRLGLNCTVAEFRKAKDNER